MHLLVFRHICFLRCSGPAIGLSYFIFGRVTFYAKDFWSAGGLAEKSSQNCIAVVHRGVVAKPALEKKPYTREA